MGYAVNTTCQYTKALTDSHFCFVKRIIRYIQGNLCKGLFYSHDPLHLTTYSDVDWGGVVTRRSTTGFIVYLDPNVISWQSNKQSTISRSAT